MKTTLTPKQERFCHEYLKDSNGTRAAIRAGYSKRTANEQAAQLLAKLSIQQRVKTLTDKISAKTEITAERVIEELMRIGLVDLRQIFGEDGQLLPLSQIPEDARRAIAGIETMEVECVTGDQPTVGKQRKIRMHDKLKALELLGKHLRVFEYAPVPPASTNEKAVIETINEAERIKRDTERILEITRILTDAGVIPKANH